MNIPPVPEDRVEHALVRLLEWLHGHGYGFQTVTPATHARVNARPDAQWARSLRDMFGWSRPFRSPLLPDDLLGVLQAGGLVEEQADGLMRSAVRVSTLEGRLFAHSAYPTQAADAVFFGPDTYRFAQLIRSELARSPLAEGGRILDLGCGAGSGGILAALDCSARGPQTWLSDVNTKALTFARANAAHAACAVRCRGSDVFDALDGEFDLVVANPPYLNDAGKRAYRDGGGQRGEALSIRIVRESLQRLRPGARLVLYTGVAMMDGADPFLDSIRSDLDNGDCTWRYRELDPDVFGEELLSPAYAKVERIAAVALVVQRRPAPMGWHLHPAMA